MLVAVEFGEVGMVEGRLGTVTEGQVAVGGGVDGIQDGTSGARSGMLKMPSCLLFCQLPT